MKNTPYQYELFRDDQRGPSCFKQTNNSFISHFHTAIELIYVRDGSITATINEQTVRVDKNQLLIIPSNMVHAFATPRFSDTTVLLIPLSYIPSYRSLFSGRTFTQLVFTEPDVLREITRCMDILAGIFSDSSGSHAEKGYIYVILGLLVDHIEMREIEEQPYLDLIHRVLKYLQEDFKNPIGLKQAAAEFGYSESRFSHLFKQSVGCTLNQYLDQLRVKNAALLLLNGNISVMEAAMESGFESMRTFYRSFNRCYGMTALQYLRQDVNGQNKK